MVKYTAHRALNALFKQLGMECYATLLRKGNRYSNVRVKCSEIALKRASKLLPHLMRTHLKRNGTFWGESKLHDLSIDRHLPNGLEVLMIYQEEGKWRAVLKYQRTTPISTIYKKYLREMTELEVTELAERLGLVKTGPIYVAKNLRKYLNEVE